MDLHETDGLPLVPGEFPADDAASSNLQPSTPDSDQDLLGSLKSNEHDPTHEKHTLCTSTL